MLALLHLCSWEASSQSCSQAPATGRERAALILCKQTLLCCLAHLAPTRHCGRKGETKYGEKGGREKKRGVGERGVLEFISVIT